MAPQELTLDGEIFDEFRILLDSGIRATIRQAIEARTNGGTITAKISFKLNPHTDNETGEIFYNPEIEPKVSTKIDKKADSHLKTVGGFVMKPDGRGGFVIGSKQVEIEDLFTEGERA